MSWILTSRCESWTSGSVCLVSPIYSHPPLCTRYSLQGNHSVWCPRKEWRERCSNSLRVNYLRKLFGVLHERCLFPPPSLFNNMSHQSGFIHLYFALCIFCCSNQSGFPFRNPFNRNLCPFDILHHCIFFLITLLFFGTTRCSRLTL